jgi:hypothetical protein
MTSLSEALANSGLITLSPFAECVVLAALYGRCMNHRGLANASDVARGGFNDFWTRSNCLETMLKKRSQLIASSSPMGLSSLECDPMLAVAYLLGHGALIYLHSITETATVQHPECFSPVPNPDSEHQAYQSAGYIAVLASSVPRLEYFKVSDKTFC